MAATVDLPAWIEQQKVSRIQILVMVLMTLTTAIDGFDAQMIGYVAPAVIRQFKVAPPEFTPVFAIGLTGLLFGCLIVAPLGDLIGRRRILLGSCIFFGITSLLTAWAGSMQSLMVLRFLTGLGLGGSMPNAIAMTAEYFPSRNRAFTTMAMFCGFPLGATLGGFLAAGLIAQFGWPSVFVVGGVLPLILAVFVAAMLPESFRYLVLKQHAAAKIKSLLLRINPAAVFPEGTTFVVHEEQAAGITVKHLFREGRALGTVLLWIIFFCSLLDIFFLSSWLPTVLHDAGLSISASVVETALFQGGGVVAGLTLGLVIDRAGFLKVLMPVYIGAGLAIASIGFVGTSLGLIMLASFLSGAFVIGGQNSMNVLAAVYYPTYIRSTGVGWALGIGRLGSIVGPIVGGVLLQMQWDRTSLFVAAAVPAFVAAVSALILSLTTGDIRADAETALIAH
ncbi:MAG TPA: MFS transporter [Xanthobacteraceae bacterium]|nr:MFS transporter [Xanthobacteraceae bacterium]